MRNLQLSAYGRRRAGYGMQCLLRDTATEPTRLKDVVPALDLTCLRDWDDEAQDHQFHALSRWGDRRYNF